MRGREACCADDRSPDLADEPHFFRHRNENARRNEAAVVVAKAEQRLETGQLSLAGRNQRLEMQLEAVVLHSVANHPLELEPRLQLGVHLRA